MNKREEEKLKRQQEKLKKELDNGRFQWPRSETELHTLSNEQFVWLMQGLSIYQPKAIRKNTPNDIV